MSQVALEKAQQIGAKVVEALGGHGLFGVELFIKGDEVYFSEVSPRPHDTGMVTLISQDLSEFALHVRAILGLPIANIRQQGPSASAVVLKEGDSNNLRYTGLAAALSEADTQLRLFGKPEIHGRRRLGVALARDLDIQSAIDKALRSAAKVEVIF
jgi:phosphoribosylglycinamide formyltransferase 2